MNTMDYQQLQHQFEEVKDFLLALGDDKRQLIIMALLQQESCHGLRVVDLTDLTNLSRPAVSHHLKILKQANIVAIRAEGTKNYYYLSDMTRELIKLQSLSTHILTIMAEKKG